MENSIQDNNKHLNLSNIGSIISFLLLIAVCFAIVRYHFYFQVFLHIPIFQFIDASELVLITATAGIKWIFYLGAVFLPIFILKEKGFTNLQKLFFSIIVLTLGVFYVRTNYLNDPVFRESLRLAKSWEYLRMFLPLLILFIIAYYYKTINGPEFFKKNKFIIPLIFTFWYGFFESWVNYKMVKKSNYIENVVLHIKTGEIIKTDSVIVNAGRTKEYWFFYNRNLKTTRIIKTENIDFIQFNGSVK